MKALAVRQPYAWLIVNEHKKVEYRPWLTHYRGRFFVHANKAIDNAEVERVRLQKAKETFICQTNCHVGVLSALLGWSIAVGLVT